MARLIAVVFLVLGYTGAVNGADVCDRIDEPTEEDLFEYADEVFHALVVRTALSDERLRQIQSERLLVEVWYELKEVLKGDPGPNEPVVTTKYVANGCGINLLVGQEYVFYATLVPFGAHDSKRFIDILNGTRWMHMNPDIAESHVEQIRAIRRRVEDLDRHNDTRSPTPP